MNNEELHSKFFAFIDAKKISQSRVARKLGVSSGTISQYRAGKYVGNVDLLESKIAAYLQREASRTETEQVPVVELSATKKIRSALSMTHAQQELCVIVGGAGTGKTTTLREYRDSTMSAVLVEVDPSYTPHTLIMAVARALGVSTTGTASSVSELIVEKLQGSDILVMFDEADYLPASSLEWIRRVVHDKGGCAVVLCGLPRLEHLLRTVRGDHDQLLSRIGVYVQVGRAVVGDTRKIVKSLWGDVSKELLSAVHDGAKGSVRRIAKLVQLAGRIARKNNESSPSVESVEDALRYVMPERTQRQREILNEEEVA